MSSNKFSSESKKPLLRNLDLLDNNNSLEIIISKPTPKQLHFGEYATVSNGQRKQSANRPHNTMIAQNSSKIEELNKSVNKLVHASPSFKIT